MCGHSYFLVKVAVDKKNLLKNARDKVIFSTLIGRGKLLGLEFAFHNQNWWCNMDRRVEAARLLLDKNLKQSPTLSELASSVNLSPSRLSHLFKIETGVSLGYYLKRARMESAKYLLGTSFLSVKQIMVCVGINDISHFARCFKEAYGVTPTEYRNSATLPLLPDTSAKSSHPLTGNLPGRNGTLMS